MEYDTTKLDEVVLALLHLNTHTQGFISDPKSKAKSVVLTEEGARKAEELFRRYFAKAV
jgi:hypothetical protein